MAASSMVQAWAYVVASSPACSGLRGLHHRIPGMHQALVEGWKGTSLFHQPLSKSCWVHHIWVGWGRFHTPLQPWCGLKRCCPAGCRPQSQHFCCARAYLQSFAGANMAPHRSLKQLHLLLQYSLLLSKSGDPPPQVTRLDTERVAQGWSNQLARRKRSKGAPL